MSLSTSTTTSALDPNDPRLTEQELALHPTPIQERLQELNNPKLQRFSCCRAWSKYEKCETGHIHCKNSARCGYHYICASCSVWDAKVRFDKYTLLRQFIPDKFFYATIISPKAASHESLRDIEKRVSQFIRSIRSADFRERCQVIFQVSVTLDKHPEVRLLCADPQRFSEEFTTELKERFPECKIAVMPHLKERYPEMLRTLLAPIGLSSEDPYRADIEEMFERIRAFHVLGFRRVELAVCDSKEKQDTINSTENGSSHHHNRNICKICGHKLIADTRWFPTNSIPKPENVEFREFLLDIGPET